MIHWAWLVFAFFGGFIFGLFTLAFAEVSRQEEKKSQKWWEENKRMKGE